jgi:hypothetical protein
VAPKLLGVSAQLTREEVERLEPWRYSSKHYFLRKAQPLSPSSIAPKTFALSTETQAMNKTLIMKKHTEQQRLILRDNPNFLDSIDHMMAGHKGDLSPKRASDELTLLPEVVTKRFHSQIRGSPTRFVQVPVIESAAELEPPQPARASSIENDRKNLNNVFGMPLRSHWVFRESPPKRK